MGTLDFARPWTPRRWLAALTAALIAAALGTSAASAHAATFPRQLATPIRIAAPRSLGPRARAAAASSLSITGSVSNPTSLGGATSVVTAGNYAYVAAYGAGRLTVVDIANPAHQSVVGSIADPRLAGADGVFLSGHYAYVAATNSNSLVIVNVSNPAAPTVVGAVTDSNLLNEAYTVFVSGGYAYVAAQGCTPNGCTDPRGNDLAIVNVSNPAAPVIVGAYRDPTGTHHATSVYVVGSKAYVTAAYSATVSIIDVATPSAPTLAGSLTSSTALPFPVDVWVDPSGHYAYVANQTNPGRVTILNVQDSAHPVAVGSVTGSQLVGAYWLTVVGTHAFVAAAGANAMAVVSVANPASPSIVDSISSTSALKVATGVAVSGAEAYVAAYGNNALTAVNVGAYVGAPTKRYAAAPLRTTIRTRVAGGFLNLSVSGGYKVPANLKKVHACSGQVTITVTKGGRTLKVATIRLSSRCTFSGHVRLKRSKVGAAKRLNMTIRFNGNARLAPVSRSYRVPLKA